MNNKYLKNVVHLELYEDKCIGCVMCINVCPHEVFKMVDGKVTIVSKDSCIECAACVKNSPVNAIEVKPGVG